MRNRRKKSINQRGKVQTKHQPSNTLHKCGKNTPTSTSRFHLIAWKQPTARFPRIMAFDINDVLKYYLSDPASVPTPGANPDLFECESEPELFDSALVDRVLNAIIDAIAESPEGLMKETYFDSLQLLLK